MDESRFKNLYNYLLKSKELYQLMFKATGDWEQDKARFIKIQTDMEDMANIKDIEKW